MWHVPYFISSLPIIATTIWIPTLPRFANSDFLSWAPDLDIIVLREYLHLGLLGISNSVHLVLNLFLSFTNLFLFTLFQILYLEVILNYSFHSPSTKIFFTKSCRYKWFSIPFPQYISSVLIFSYPVTLRASRPLVGFCTRTALSSAVQLSWSYKIEIYIPALL